jgi:hypothetical protein
MSIKWKSPKDPDEKLDYRIKWANRIEEDDEIVSSVWEVTTPDATLVIDDDSIDGTDTIVWFTGGTEGEKYDVLNRVQTLLGRRMDQTGVLTIKSK